MGVIIVRLRLLGLLGWVGLLLVELLLAADCPRGRRSLRDVVCLRLLGRVCKGLSLCFNSLCGQLFHLDE